MSFPNLKNKHKEAALLTPQKFLDYLKKRGKYYLTLYPHYPNFRSYVMEHLPIQTKELVKQWASLEPLKGDTLTYPGCNIITFAELTQTSLFKGLEIRGRLEYCCGETLFRTGYKDELFQVTKRLDKWFKILKPKNLLVLCTAGTNVFKNILPQYGLTYKFDKIEEKVRLKLKKEEEQAFLSYKLAEIVTDMEIKMDLKKCVLSDYDENKVEELFEELEFKSLLKRLPGAEDKKSEEKKDEQPKDEQMGLFWNNQMPQIANNQINNLISNKQIINYYRFWIKPRMTFVIFYYFF